MSLFTALHSSLGQPLLGQISLGQHLLSQPLLAQTTTRTYYEAARLRQLDQWWHWLVLLLVCLALVGWVSRLYRADTRSLPTSKGWLLLLLRLAAFAGLLVFFLNIQRRTEQKIVKNSRMAILVDTSQSMGIADVGSAELGAQAAGTANGTTATGTARAKSARITAVVNALSGSTLLDRLREKHDVSVYRFDESSQPAVVATYPQSRDGVAVGDDNAAESTAEDARRLNEARWLWNIAGGCVAVALLALLGHLLFQARVRTAEGESWALLVGIFMLLVGLVFAAVSNLRRPQIGPLVAWGVQTLDTSTSDTNNAATQAAASGSTDSADATVTTLTTAEWTERLKPAGGATRLGDAVLWVLNQERGQPLAAIGVFTDGNGNRGVEGVLAAKQARSVGVPIYPVGLASDLPPTNLRLVDLEAPARVYPGDEFHLTGYVQAYGMQGQTVRLQLRSRPAEASGDTPDDDQQDTAAAGVILEDERDVVLAADGEVLPVSLQVVPEAVGKRVYWLQADQAVDPNASDNSVSAKIQIIDRKSRVLLVAGGPTRDYRFVRNMLHRDQDVQVDVLLQTAVDGVSQEAEDILFDLPYEPAELFEYDTIVAFDPDWTKFELAQLELLERWVAEKAGGMVCVAGPVHTPGWAETRDATPAANIVRQLYPVTFNTTRVRLGRFAASTAWPLQLTADGRSVPFLQLSNEPADGADSWQEFPGVYGYYAVRDVKPAATVFARFSDPQTMVGDQLPPLVVGQFYGAGRVVFLGTGEFWRLRAVDNAYFERFYTKLLRYVSEGRLLRDSNRGLLLVDKERALRGDTIAVRASVVDQQFRPLTDLTIPAYLLAPDGSRQRLELSRVDSTREGAYAGRFTATLPGDYSVQLTLPGDGEPVTLSRDVRVKLPNLEIERPQRNDDLLQQMAAQTTGKYYIGTPAAVDQQTGLAAQIRSKRRETYLPGSIDREFELRLMSWLLTLICGSLCLEWLLRRLNKLA